MISTAMPDITDPSEQRRLLALCFEPDGDGFIFFRNRWASGIPVTAEEREAYLSASPFGFRRDFYGAIKGRVPVRPPRKNDGWLRWQLLRSFPAFTIAVYLIGALLLFSFASDQRQVVWRCLLILAGALSLGMSAAIVLAKMIRPPNQRADRISG
jgi:hypothetical protein